MKRTDKAHWGRSLRDLKWDKHGAKTPAEKLISENVHTWYDERHSEPSQKEIDFVNSRKVTCCPYCGKPSVVKDGHYDNGIQRYLCKSCHKRFNPLTNTIFDEHKIPISEWIEYLIYLFEFHSINTAARDSRNAVTTGRYWLVKVFAILKNSQNGVQLSGDIYIDEMYFPVIKSKEILKDGKKLRGISKNKIGVATAYDQHGNMLLICENTSKPSRKSTWEAYGSHIKLGSHLIHDGDNSHQILIERLNLSESVYESKATKGLKDKDNPLDPINNIHSLAKRYMKAHGGYDRDDLQDWMNLIWFILSDPTNRYEKVKKFIELALDSPKRVKYRDVMSK